MEIVNKNETIDEKGVGHITGQINGKAFHVAGESGYANDVVGNLTDEEFGFIVTGEEEEKVVSKSMEILVAKANHDDDLADTMFYPVNYPMELLGETAEDLEQLQVICDMMFEDWQIIKVEI